MHDGQHLLIIDAKVLLCWGKLAAFKGDRLSLLHQNGPNAQFGCVTLNCERHRKIRYSQIAVGAHDLLEDFKGFLSSGAPCECVLLGELCEWSGQVGKPSYESLVVIAKSQKPS